MKRLISRTAIPVTMPERWLFYGLSINQAALVLGSATPSLESRARAGKGVYQHLCLTQRANPLARIPEVEVIGFQRLYWPAGIRNLYT